MYEDSWYSFVPEFQQSRGPSAAQGHGHGHRRKESLLQQPKPNGADQAAGVVEPLDELFEDVEEAEQSPPAPTIARRAKSYSDFYDIVRAQMSKDARKKTRKRKDKSWEALALPEPPASAESPCQPPFDAYDHELLEASQQEYLLYHDQLAMTERHLDVLIEDANGALDLLASLSDSFHAVEEQTSSFKAQCEDVLVEQKRFERLADEVGTELHYYAYLDTVSRRLNAPGASRLVDDESFGEILRNLDSCIAFMKKNPTYRDAESYLARYQSLLTKALHLLEVGYTSRLDKVSTELSKQIAGSQSESTRHALAYGRFEEVVLDSYSLVPNVQKVIRRVYDQLGNAKSGPGPESYTNSAKSLIHAYLAARDRDLKPVVQSDLDALKAEAKNGSAETAARNFLKQSFERSYAETNLFSRIFSVEVQYSNDSSSLFGVLKAYHTALVNGVNISPIATNLQAALHPSGLQTICNVMEWTTNEFLLLEYDEDETPFTRHCRELTARLLAEHMWPFTDAIFEAEITRAISRAPVVADELKIGAVVDGVASSNTYPPIKRALELLVLFDQSMPKERCQRNSPVVFKLVTESIQALQRAEARLKTGGGGGGKTGTDADLFMIKNLLMLKNELVSLEIGDIRDQTAGMQHFTHIWETLTPQNLMGFFSSFIPGSLWGGGGGGPGDKPSWSNTANGTSAGSDEQQHQQQQDASEQLDELLRRSIVAFTQRWGTRVGDARRPGTATAGTRSAARVEEELETALQTAFSNQQEVMGKLKEAIEISARAQGEKKKAAAAATATGGRVGGRA